MSRRARTERDEATTTLRQLLSQIDRAWTALAVLGPDSQVTSTLDAASSSVSEYLRSRETKGASHEPIEGAPHGRRKP